MALCPHGYDECYLGCVYPGRCSGPRRAEASVDPVDAIYEKAERDPVYRERFNEELDGLGMPWLKAPEPPEVSDE